MLQGREPPILSGYIIIGFADSSWSLLITSPCFDNGLICFQQEGSMWFSKHQLIIEAEMTNPCFILQVLTDYLSSGSLTNTSAPQKKEDLHLSQVLSNQIHLLNWKLLQSHSNISIVVHGGQSTSLSKSTHQRQGYQGEKRVRGGGASDGCCG